MGEVAVENFKNYYASTTPLEVGKLERQAQAQTVLELLLKRIGEKIIFIGEGSGATMAWLATDVASEHVACVVAVEPSGPPFGNPKIRIEKRASDPNTQSHHPLVRSGEEIVTRIWDHKSGYNGSVRRYGLADIPLTYDPPVDSPTTFFEELTGVEEGTSTLVPPRGSVAEESRKPVFNLAEFHCPSDPRKTAWLQTAVSLDNEDPFIDEQGREFPNDKLPGRPKKLVNVMKVPHAVITGHASSHVVYDWATVTFLRQAGCDTTWIRLEDHNIHGNGHLMFLESNSTEIAEVIFNWITHKLSTAPPNPPPQPTLAPVLAAPSFSPRLPMPRPGYSSMTSTVGLSRPAFGATYPTAVPHAVSAVTESTRAASTGTFPMGGALAAPSPESRMSASVRLMAAAGPIVISEPMSTYSGIMPAVMTPRVCTSGATEVGSRIPLGAVPSFFTPVSVASTSAMATSADPAPTGSTSSSLPTIGTSTSTMLGPIVPFPDHIVENEDEMSLVQHHEPTNSTKRPDEEDDACSGATPSKMRKPRSDMITGFSAGNPTSGWTSRDLPAATTGPAPVSLVVTRTPAPSPSSRPQQELSHYMQETYGTARQLPSMPTYRPMETANLFETTQSPYYLGVAGPETGFIETNRGMFSDGSPAEPIYDPTLMAHNTAPLMPPYTPREEQRFDPYPFSSGRRMAGDGMFPPILMSPNPPTSAAAAPISGSGTGTFTMQDEANKAASAAVADAANETSNNGLEQASQKQT